jgi:hypothetical protein
MSKLNCSYCNSSGESKECQIEHKAHMETVKLAYDLAVNDVNSSVCKIEIRNIDWNKMYTNKFAHYYELNIKLQINKFTEEYNKKNIISA